MTHTHAMVINKEKKFLLGKVCIFALFLNKVRIFTRFCRDKWISCIPVRLQSVRSIRLYIFFILRKMESFRLVKLGYDFRNYSKNLIIVYVV